MIVCTQAVTWNVLGYTLWWWIWVWQQHTPRPTIHLYSGYRASHQRLGSGTFRVRTFLLIADFSVATGPKFSKMGTLNPKLVYLAENFPRCWNLGEQLPGLVTEQHGGGSWQWWQLTSMTSFWTEEVELPLSQCCWIWLWSANLTEFWQLLLSILRWCWAMLLYVYCKTLNRSRVPNKHQVLDTGLWSR